VHWNARNIGVAAGRNLATRLGKAPYVVSLDNDAVFGDRRCVARAVAALTEQPSLGGLAFRIVDEATGSDHMYWDYPEAYRGAGLASFEVTRFLGGGHALRRDAFERAGGYDDRLFFGGEERDVAWRMIRLGYVLRWERELTVLHRSVSENKLTYHDRRFYFLVRNALYINHKFGAGVPGFARGATSFMLKGARNGLLPAAVRGIAAGCAMSLRFSYSDAAAKDQYRLTPEQQRYIADIDHKTGESALRKLRRQLTALPAV
jgi:GT2 family glycosyltransferase